MTSAILKGNSKSDIQLLLDLAKKMGITAKFFDGRRGGRYGIRACSSRR
jgi:hypothetical protein